VCVREVEREGEREREEERELRVGLTVAGWVFASCTCLSAIGGRGAGICSGWRNPPPPRKHPLPLGPLQGPRHGPSEGSKGGAVSDERGTPVTLFFEQTAAGLHGLAVVFISHNVLINSF